MGRIQEIKNSLKEREDGCNRAGYYVRDYAGKVISTPLQYLASGLVSSLDLNYNDNFQEAKYLFEKLQELYSIIVRIWELLPESSAWN